MSEVHVTLMDTTHFSFLGLGETAEQAENAVASAFSGHLVQYNPGDVDERTARERFSAETDGPEDGLMDADVWRALVGDYYGFRTVELHPGQASRDGETVFGEVAS